MFGGLQVNGRSAFRVQNYYIAWVVVLTAMVLALNLVHSRVGRALRSIHESEEAAHSLGVNTYRYKLAVFILSALLAAVGGILLTHYNGSIGPSEATVMKSVRYVAIVAVGGMANLWGAMVMGILLNFLSLRGVFGSYDDAVFGSILIVMMLFAPQGLLRVPRLRAMVSLLLPGGTMAKRKSKIQNPKSETISNVQNPKYVIRGAQRRSNLRLADGRLLRFARNVRTQPRRLIIVEFWICFGLPERHGATGVRLRRSCGFGFGIWNLRPGGAWITSSWKRGICTVPSAACTPSRT